MATTEPSNRRRWWWLKYLVQAAIFSLVGWGIWRTIQQAQGKMLATGVDWKQLQFGWLFVSACSYLLGMLPCGLFWHRVVNALRQKVPRGDAVRAFFLSQLGKYVPGKVMVLVIRTAAVQCHEVNKTLTVASIFVETLTMMSVGGMLGAFLLATSISADWRLSAGALLSAIAVGAPTLPPIFRFVVKFTRLHRQHPEVDEALADLDWHTLWPGWLSIAGGWLAMGFSLWCVLRALPGDGPAPSFPGDLPLVVACVALSTVAGFASGIPGGLGAREFVVMQLIQPYFGPSAAVLSAIVHRLVMLAAELVAASVIWCWGKARG